MMHTHIHGENCRINDKKSKHITKKNNEFYFFPLIRFTSSTFEGNYLKGRYLNNGYKKLIFSINFLNYEYKTEKIKKLTKKNANTSI